MGSWQLNLIGVSQARVGIANADIRLDFMPLRSHGHEQRTFFNGKTSFWRQIAFIFQILAAELLNLIVPCRARWCLGVPPVNPNGLTGGFNFG